MLFSISKYKFCQTFFSNKYLKVPKGESSIFWSFGGFPLIKNNFNETTPCMKCMFLCPPLEQKIWNFENLKKLFCPICCCLTTMNKQINNLNYKLLPLKLMLPSLASKLFKIFNMNLKNIFFSISKVKYHSSKISLSPEIFILPFLPKHRVSKYVGREKSKDFSLFCSLAVLLHENPM